MEFCLNKQSTLCALQDDVAVQLPKQTNCSPTFSRFLFTTSSKIIHASETFLIQEDSLSFVPSIRRLFTSPKTNLGCTSPKINLGCTSPKNILSNLFYDSVASLPSPSSSIEAWPYDTSLRIASLLHLGH